MSTQAVFLTHLVLGYVAWGLIFAAYARARLPSMERFDTLRIIAALHSFRFFGLAFILPGFVGSELPSSFATFAAYGDLATGVLAMLALLTFRVRAAFLTFAIAFNVVGAIDIIVDYYHGVQIDLGSIAGQLGAGYAIPILYVPALMITHIIAFYAIFRRQALPSVPQ